MKAHQMTSQMKGKAPSAISSTRQFQSAQNPSRKGRRNDHRDREAEHPVGVGARALAPRKPVREQHQHGGPHPALRHPQQKAHHPKLLPGVDQAATDGTKSPHDQQDAHEPFGAPALAKVSSRNLQQPRNPRKKFPPRRRLAWGSCGARGSWREGPMRHWSDR
jgi:hypothetical protein